ncbi:MAG: YHYH protein [Limisphaerales bacterium]
MKPTNLLTAASLALAGNLAAHTIDHHDAIPHVAVPKIEFATITGNRLVLGKKDGKLTALNTVPVARVAAVGSTPLPSASARLMQSAFGAFPKVKTRSDGRYFYIESDSIPDHNMMVGITAWQQQVPIPQPYTGNNAWQIPLNPVPARNPLSAKNNFFRGAIALAVNGVPIFNPIKNNGVTDTFTAGELDQWGGHCGRADDYHYHIAPVHLQNQVGRGKPVAWALDGYAIYGYTEANGATARNLDRFNGHDHGTGYHYHATKTYPYLNGGFHGEVQNSGGQVSPQPRASGVRPYTRPLRGAKITGFTGNLQNGYSLKYDVSGRTGYVNYKVAADRTATFTFIDTSGRNTTENYTPRQRRQGGGGGGERRPRPSDNRRPQNREMSEDELLDFFLGGKRDQPSGKRPRSDNNRPTPKGQESGEDRKPWIAAHLTELDTDRDGNVSKAEMLAEAAKTFAGYDRNRDGKLTADEYNGRSGARSAMGGFVKQHAAEFDRDGDQVISRDEVNAFALRMFTKADRDQNNIVTNEEASTRGGGGGGKGGKKGQKRPR